MSKMIEAIQAMFPMSKGAFLAVSFISLAGGAGFVQIQSNMSKMLELQERTIDDIHEIDKRLTVVEHQLDGTIVFRSGPEHLQQDTVFSNPRTFSP